MYKITYPIHLSFQFSTAIEEYNCSLTEKKYVTAARRLEEVLNASFKHGQLVLFLFLVNFEFSVFLIITQMNANFLESRWNVQQ